MTTHITKTWFDGKTVVTVTKEIPVEEVYKREWVGLTEDEVAQAMYRADAIVTGPMQFKFAKELEAKLKEKNT